MALFGSIVLWTFAIFGGVMAALMIIGAYVPDQAKVEATDASTAPAPAQVPLQVTNLRTLPPPDEAAEPAAVLQKTTMQITTTKYIDPNAATKELSA